MCDSLDEEQERGGNFAAPYRASAARSAVQLDCRRSPTQLSGPELTAEIGGSRRFLQRTYGVPSDNFCYPSSIYDSSTIAAVEAAGYVGAVTENAGYASRDRPYELDRYEIEGGQGVEGLAADLSR